MPPSTTKSLDTWSGSGWQSKQWKGKRSGTQWTCQQADWTGSWWEQDPRAQWTGWQGNSTGSWWENDSWKADPPEDSPKGRDDGGDSGDERDEEEEEEEEEEEPTPWEHCVAKGGQTLGAAKAKLPDADDLRALHEAALRQFLDNDDDLPGSDVEVAPNAAPPEVAALPEVLPIHGADAGYAFYNTTTGGVDCQLCGMHLNSLKQWEDHRTGKKHVKKSNNPKLACPELPPG